MRTLGGLFVVTRARTGADDDLHVNDGGAADAHARRNGHGTNGHANGNGHDGNGNGHGESDVWRELRVELARARRFGRSFALVRLTGSAAHGVRGHLRAIDREWVVNRETYVLLPESDREGAER